MSRLPVHIVSSELFIFVIFTMLRINGMVCIYKDVLRCDKGVLFDGGQDITKLDFCCECVSMVDDWHSIWTIPAVH